MITFLKCTFAARSFLLLSLIPLVGQESKAQGQRQQIYFQHDNDFLFAIDRYYTTGTFLGYSTQLKNDFLLKRSTANPIQLDLVLGQETYTPRELFEFNFELLERPYAGYVFLSGLVSQVRKNNILNLKMEVGLAGEQSLAGDFQIAYHELINEFIPTWAGEIGNSFHVNGYGSLLSDFPISNSNLFKNITLRSTVALGTRRVFARQEALLFFGKRAEAGKTSAFNRLNPQEEFYGLVGIGSEYVLLNALIQGHPLRDNSPFTLPITNVIFSLKAGATYRGLHTKYLVMYHYRTRETFREGRSQFISFGIARQF